MEHLIAGIAVSISGAVQGANTQYMEKVAEELQSRSKAFAEKMHKEYQDDEADLIIGHLDTVMGNFSEMLSGVWEKVIPEEMKVAKVDSPKPKRPRKAGITTAWLEFSKVKRSELKEAEPDMTFADLGAAVGGLWKEVSDDDKEGWKEQAERVNEANANGPKCDWIFGKGKHKDEVCGGIATVLDDDLVRCKKHKDSRKKRAKAEAVAEAAPNENIIHQSENIIRALPVVACDVCNAPTEAQCSCEKCDQCGNRDFEKCECGECWCKDCERECDCQPVAKQAEEDPDATIVLGELLEVEGSGDKEEDPTLEEEVVAEEVVAEEVVAEEVVAVAATCQYKLRGGLNRGKPCGKDAASCDRCKRHTGK